jgi:splicing factor 4
MSPRLCFASVLPAEAVIPSGYVVFTHCLRLLLLRRAQEVAARIGGDNKGHQMMQKMGWSEGAGLGAAQGGMATPINAGEVKQDNLGVGAANTHEVSEADDIYEAYKKRMMLGYKHRPNPLGNPRKQYY